jgi:hypothetical protein
MVRELMKWLQPWPFKPPTHLDKSYVSTLHVSVEKSIFAYKKLEVMFPRLPKHLLGFHMIP